MPSTPGVVFELVRGDLSIDDDERCDVLPRKLRGEATPRWRGPSLIRGDLSLQERKPREILAVTENSLIPSGRCRSNKSPTRPRK